MNWAVFISGKGSNLQSLLDASPKISIGIVISSRAEAGGIARAESAGVPVLVLPKDIDWEELTKTLHHHQIDRIFLAGFMKILPEQFVSQWPQKILNLHPSLLPSYPGLHAIERSYQDGAAMGVTIHWVTPQLDAGPILIQQQVFPQGQATLVPLETVRERIQHVENKMVVDAIRRCEEC